MKQKKARYVMQALQSWCTTTRQMENYIKYSDYPGFMYMNHIRDVLRELMKRWYAKKEQSWHCGKYSVLKEVSSQSQIVLHWPIEDI